MIKFYETLASIVSTMTILVAGAKGQIARLVVRGLAAMCVAHALVRVSYGMDLN